MVQYHPKGIKGTPHTPNLNNPLLICTGGMMPELDSHTPSPINPTPLKSRFSPWHACGSDHKVYYPGMRRAAHLTLEGCVLRLQPGDYGHEAAARQWEEIFGVARSRDLLAFTNARLGFVPGRKGCAEGLISITVGVAKQKELDALLNRALSSGMCNNGCVKMCGVQWNFVLTGHGDSKL